MKNKISKLLISMGLLIIIGSLMLISYSKYVDGKALQSFEEKIEKKEVISKVNPGDEIGIIEIESVNLKNVIVESTDKSYLNHHVCHFENTAMPGQDGNFALAGHSSTYYYNQVFNEVHKVKVGDKIKITTVDDEFVYTITKTRVVESDEIDVLDQDMKMSLKKKIVALLSVATLTLMVGCSSSESNEQEVTNSNEQEVVVATSVAVTEILDKLGVEVSGVPTTSYELPENTKEATKVGSPMNPDLEIIKSLNPTCVVSVDTLGSDFEKQFTENNIPSIFVNLSTVDGLKETITTLGEKFDKKDKAKEIIKELDDKEKELTLTNKENKEKVLVLFGAPGSVMVSTDSSYVGNLVKIAGGNNIFESDSSSFIQVNMEEIIKRNPDKILIMTHAVPEEAKKTVEEEFAKSTWQQLDAIKNNKVYFLENGYFGMSANLKAIEALDKLGDILYE